jgi:hypothetical protein
MPVTTIDVMTKDWGAVLQLHVLLTSSLATDEKSDSRSSDFTPLKAEWAADPVWKQWLRKNFIHPPGIESRVVQPAFSHEINQGTECMLRG